MDVAKNPGIAQGHHCEVQQVRTIPYLFAFFVAYLGGMAALRFIPMPRGLQIVVALAPAPIFALYIRRWVHVLRQVDELQRLITLEALAFAYPLTLILIMTIGLLEMVGAIPHDLVTYLRLWPLVFWFYFIGLIAARRRYR
jgi:hypothetical protein